MRTVIERIVCLLLFLIITPRVAHATTQQMVTMDLFYPISEQLITNPVLSVYSLTKEEYQEAEQKKITTDVTEATNFIKVHKLTKLMEQTLNSKQVIPLTLPVTYQQTDSLAYYLIMQEVDSVSTSGEENRLYPILLTPDNLASESLTIQGKLVPIDGDIYFFKVSETKIPLEGAEFVIYRLTEQGAKDYLVSSSPMKWGDKKDQATLFVSDTTGLVRVPTRTFETGHYYMEEVKAPDGYEITEQAKKIAINLTRDGEDSQQNQAIYVNQQRLTKFQANHLSKQVVEQLEPSIVNQSLDGTPPTKEAVPGKNQPRLTGSTGKLPQTNEQKTIVAALGTCLLMSSTLILLSKRREKNE